MSRVLLMSAMLVFSTLQAGAVTAVSAIKGYQEWKGEKIQLALNQGISIRAQIQKAQSEGNKKLADSLERQQNQINWNVDVARDLSVTDYFVLYLSQQPQADRFQQAAQKMSTKEVAELIEAYANTLGTSPTEVIVQPAPQAGTHEKLPVQATQAK